MGIVILKRRQFLRGSLALIGLGAVNRCSRLPLPANRPPTIGYLGLGYPRNLQLLGIFIDQLRELDSPHREIIVVEQRPAEPDAPLLSLARELVALKVDLIFAPGTPFVQAAKQATSTIPIVSISPDPVGTGIVSSLARPSSNVTGISMLTSGTDAKRVELLKETIPSARRVDVFWDPNIADKRANLLETQRAASNLGLQVRSREVTDPNGFDAVFEAIAGDRPDVLITLVDAFTNGNWPRVAEFALEQRLPSICEARGHVTSGGLMSYGQDFANEIRRAATFADRILRGGKPTELPIEQPTKFDLVISKKTADELGLTIPQSILAQANEIIE